MTLGRVLPPKARGNGSLGKGSANTWAIPKRVIITPTIRVSRCELESNHPPSPPAANPKGTKAIISPPRNTKIRCSSRERSSKAQAKKAGSKKAPQGARKVTNPPR